MHERKEGRWERRREDVRREEGKIGNSNRTRDREWKDEGEWKLKCKKKGG